MNSNTLRYIVGGILAVLATLSALGVLTAQQAHTITTAVLAGYAFGQGQLTPATNARTPDNAPPALPVLPPR